VQYALGKANHEIVNEAVEALEQGDAKRLGALMRKAQKLFDENVAPACPEELTAPILHSVLNDKKISEWVYGGKGVGSQGDGTVQFLAKDKESQKALVDYLNHERNMDAYPFALHAGGRVQKAIIPVAGFGTRMYPETHFIKKAFLPVIDKNGIVKPTLLCILEELDQEGIEEMILVVGEDEVEDFKKVFEFEMDNSFKRKLPQNVREYYDLIHRLGGKIRYAVQKERKGFGHAVYQAKQFLKDEPALLLLGDFIYRSEIGYSCTRQTINAYNKSGGKAVVSIKEVPLEEVVHYGVISGEFDDDRTYMMQVSDMVEKPTVDYAKDYLGVRDKKKQQAKYYATFGQYVLTPDIFDYLGKQIAESVKNGGAREIDLTYTLKTLAEKGKLTGVKIAGKSYDVGIPSAYAETLQEYKITGYR
jgi:UTP-glucose-1-phosphate uridylyltransferase